MINAKIKEKTIAETQKCVLPSSEYLTDVPIVAFSGLSGSGKTSFIEKLIPVLKSRGYRIASLKHAHHQAALVAGKDSERYLDAGSDASLLAAPDRLILTMPANEYPSIDAMLYLRGDDYDIILCEGFKQADIPKIIVRRQACGDLPAEPGRVIGIISDTRLDTSIRQYAFEDVAAIADMLESEIIIPHANRINISVNHHAVPLIEFPRSIISKTILGMLTALKGVGLIRQVRISISRDQKEA
jgi:molybdopterin-guanine dinucleotide biosynthesis protein MobB